MQLTDYIDAVCEVKTVKNDLILTGRVKKINSDGVEIYDPPNQIPIISMDTPVKVELHKTGTEFRVLTGRVYISNHMFVRVVDIVNFADFEKRRYFRLDIDHSAMLIVPPPKGHKPAEQEAPPQPIEISVRVRNISLCGLLFLCKEVLMIGDEVQLRMTLFNNKEDTMTVVVRRIQRLEDDKLMYGAEIVEMNTRAERSLCAFLFREQQEQIRRTREKRGMN